MRTSWKYFDWMIIFSAGLSGVAVHFHRYDWAVGIGVWTVAVSINSVRLLLEEWRDKR